MNREDFLAHYGVKGMKKGVRKEYDPSQDKLGNGDPNNLVRTDSNNLLSTVSTSTYGEGGEQNNTYAYDRGRIDRFIDKMFDHKVTTIRGKNASTRTQQGKVNKFVDKISKQIVRAKKNVMPSKPRPKPATKVSKVSKGGRDELP